MSKLLVFGGGGHAKVVIDAAIQEGSWDEIFVLDDKLEIGSLVAGARVIGRIDEYQEVAGEYDAAVVAIGENRSRAELQSRLHNDQVSLATIIHPAATISSSASVGSGSVVFAGAIVNSDAEIGRCCIINTGATVDHDCKLSDGVHISPGANLAGEVHVGTNAWIGIGATVIQGVSIGDDSIVGAGAVVISDISPESLVAGVPARLKRKIVFK